MDCKEIIQELGGSVEVARLCECTTQAVSQWFGINPRNGKERKIPHARLLYLRAIRPNVFDAKEAPKNLRGVSLKDISD